MNFVQLPPNPSFCRSCAQDHPELYSGKIEAMEAAFKEYNCFGLADVSDNYKLPEKDCVAMKVAWETFQDTEPKA